MAGDAMHDIRSFTVRLGTRRVFNIATCTLCSLFAITSAGFIAAALRSTLLWQRSLRIGIAGISLAAAAAMVGRARSVDPSSPGQVYAFYMDVWKLFYASYMILPFAR